MMPGNSDPPDPSNGDIREHSDGSDQGHPGDDTATDPHTAFDIDVDAWYLDPRPVTGQVVTVLDFHLDSREFDLLDTPSRALVRHEVHELIVTPDSSAGTGRTLTGAVYVCFFEVAESGMALAGMDVQAGGQTVGTIAGFDATHEPNHLNVVCTADEPLTGGDLEIATGDGVRIHRSD